MSSMQLRSALRPIARTLKRHPSAYRFAKNLYSKLAAPEYRFLSSIARAGDDVFFLQIGAHDGKTDDLLHDLIRKHGWKGVLVEPVPYLFDRLVRNYSGIPGLAFENKAIGADDGHETFYYLRQNDALPSWYDQLGSFDKQVILSHKDHIPDIERYIVAEPVDCISFTTLVAAHCVRRIDLILIDTEGYDLQILQQIDFSRFSPNLVIYEQKHLSDADKQRARTFLTERGYSVFNVGGNDVAKRHAVN
jgi:FkbM family methyltransferase